MHLIASIYYTPWGIKPVSRHHDIATNKRATLQTGGAFCPCPPARLRGTYVEIKGDRRATKKHIQAIQRQSAVTSFLTARKRKQCRSGAVVPELVAPQVLISTVHHELQLGRSLLYGTRHQKRVGVIPPGQYCRTSS